MNQGDVTLTAVADLARGLREAPSSASLLFLNYTRSMLANHLLLLSRDDLSHFLLNKCSRARVWPHITTTTTHAHYYSEYKLTVTIASSSPVRSFKIANYKT